MKKKILFDLTSFQPQGNVRNNGGGEYAWVLFEAIYERVHQSIDVLIDSKLGLNDKLKKIIDDNDIDVISYSQINEVSNICTPEKYCVLVLPVNYPSYYAMKVSDEIRVIAVMHDLSCIFDSKVRVKYGRYPKRDGLNWLRKIYDWYNDNINYKNYVNQHKEALHHNRNQKNITVSYFSKYSIVNYVDAELGEGMEVLYSHAKSSGPVQDESDFLEKNGLVKGEYLLLSSAARWKKNNAIAIMAIDSMLSDDTILQLRNCKIVVLGVNSLFEEYYRRIIKNIDHFLFFDYIETEELEQLYRNAHLFVYPSVLEGFGYPPIEAMKYETISACSSATSIPEICGDAAIYFNPYELDSIRIAILKSFETEYYEEKKKKAKTRFAEISARQNRDFEKLVSTILEYEEDKIDG